jgi:hypothetical protein
MDAAAAQYERLEHELCGEMADVRTSRAEAILEALPEETLQRRIPRQAAKRAVESRSA